MRINFKLGLLRLWIVISLCWIAIAIMLFYNEMKNEIQCVDYKLFEKAYSLSTDSMLGKLSDNKKEMYKEAIRRKLIPDIEFLGFPYGFIPDNLQKEDINKMPIRVQYLYIVKEFPPNTTIQDIWKAYRPDLIQKRNYALFILGMIALIPPIILLIFGRVIIWIIYGFIPKDKNT